MRRRFEKRVYIALPEEGARTAMYKLNLGETPHSITDSEFEEVSRYVAMYLLVLLTLLWNSLPCLSRSGHHFNNNVILMSLYFHCLFSSLFVCLLAGW